MNPIVIFPVPVVDKAAIIADIQERKARAMAATDEREYATQLGAAYDREIEIVRGMVL